VKVRVIFEFSRKSVNLTNHSPDHDNLLLLAQWVGVDHVKLPVNEAAIDESEHPKMVIHGSNETTLESVAVHLHADEYLKPEDVDLLMKVLRDQYTWLRKRNQEVVPG
jgi:hypothetical protein